MFEVLRARYQGTALNYCKVCRRHLNGAVSCPGCGATGVELSSVQDARSTVRMPRVGDRVDGAEPPPELVPTSVLESEEDLDDPGADLDQQPEPEFETAVEREEPAPVPAPSYAPAGPAAPTLMHAASSPGDRDDDTSSFDLVTDEHHGRRGSRRRGLGLMVTGGCAGVAVVGFLVLGGGGSGSPAGVAVKSSGTVSVVGSPGATGSAGSGQNLGTASFVAPTASSAPPSASSAPATATHTASAAPSTESAPTTTAPTSTKPTASASRSHSAPPASPSKTFCLLFC
jgi:hypothetical protein